MNSIYFIGSTNNSYGRGKDKTKRKSRVGLLSGAAIGGGLSSLKAGRTLSGAIGGAVIGAGTGMLVDKGIDKEKERYKKEGPRTRFGKIINDAKVGAKSIGTVSVIPGAIGGGAIGAIGGANAKAAIIRGLGGAVIGGGITGASGALSGASWGGWSWISQRILTTK